MAWAPVMAHLAGCRSIAIDLPGFGLSDPYSYSGRPLRAHADAQLTSVLDALALDRAVLVGTSLGGMWVLCLAVDAPERWPPWSASACPRWRCQGAGRSLDRTPDEL